MSLILRHTFFHVLTALKSDCLKIDGVLQLLSDRRYESVTAFTCVCLVIALHSVVTAMSQAYKNTFKKWKTKILINKKALCNTFFLFSSGTYIMVYFKINGSCMQWHKPLIVNMIRLCFAFISLNFYFYLLKRTTLDSIKGNMLSSIRFT